MTITTRSVASRVWGAVVLARAGKSFPVLGSIGLFFGLKVLVGMALVVQSARVLPVAEFGAFSQLFLFNALVGTIAAGGVQNGLIRQVAAARDAFGDQARAVQAALVIWVAAASLLLIAAALLPMQLSELLVGSTEAAPYIRPIISAAVIGGCGQVLCAFLTGAGRTPLSLLLQSAGLGVGGALCWLRLSSGDPQGAVFGYAMGPALILPAALPWTVRWLPISRARRAKGVLREARLLLGFSVAFLLTAVLMPSTLFALRYVYRDAFGGEMLGYWLIANRVSDVTSQVLGLYMGQVFLPAAARCEDSQRMRRLTLHTLLFGTLMMGGGVVVFVGFAPGLVSLFLSPAYLGAIPFITGYLAGDVLRVATSAALHGALARGRLVRYVTIEGVTSLLLALYILAFIQARLPTGGYWGYMLAHGTMAALVWGTLLSGRRMSYTGHHRP